MVRVARDRDRVRVRGADQVKMIKEAKELELELGELGELGERLAPALLLQPIRKGHKAATMAPP